MTKVLGTDILEAFARGQELVESLPEVLRPFLGEEFALLPVHEAVSRINETHIAVSTYLNVPGDTTERLGNIVERVLSVLTTPIE